MRGPGRVAWVPRRAGRYRTTTRGGGVGVHNGQNPRYFPQLTQTLEVRLVCMVGGTQGGVLVIGDRCVVSCKPREAVL